MGTASVIAHSELEFLHFDVGVRESVDIHGCQVGAAPHAHAKTPAATSFTSSSSSLHVLVQTERRQKLQREEEATSLLQAVQLLVLPLWTESSH